MFWKFNPTGSHFENSEAFRKLGPLCEQLSIFYRPIDFDRTAEGLKKIDIDFMGNRRLTYGHVTRTILIKRGGQSKHKLAYRTFNLFNTMFNGHSDTKSLSTLSGQPTLVQGSSCGVFLVLLHHRIRGLILSERKISRTLCPHALENFLQSVCSVAL